MDSTIKYHKLIFNYDLKLYICNPKKERIQSKFNSMTKADIVTKISEKLGIEKGDVQATVEAFMEEVKLSLEAGEDVFLRGFGSFIIKTRAEKNREKYFQKHHHQNSSTQHSLLQTCKSFCRRSKKQRESKIILTQKTSIYA